MLIKAEGKRRPDNVKDYTFYYFELHGRGDAIRMMLSRAGVGFDDIHIAFNAWSFFEERMPNKNVPALEFHDGKLQGGSKLIL